MSNYTADYREIQHELFVNKWVPRDEKLTGFEGQALGQYRYTLARARAAETELKELKDALSALRKLLA